MVCTFFGHRNCYDLNTDILIDTIKSLIEKGVDTFYVGNQGFFDTSVFSCLIKLQETFPFITVSVVLAYLPSEKSACDLHIGYSIYPEELEGVIPRFAIERRNKWMIEQAKYCVCFINHTWGGAYKFAKRAKNKGLTVINLGKSSL